MACHSPFAYIDIDHFKSFNDVYGYEAGDGVIKEAAESLISASGQIRLTKGFPGHIGGDDFVLIGSIEEMKVICRKSQNDLMPSVWFTIDRKIVNAEASAARTGAARSRNSPLSRCLWPWSPR